MSNIYYNPEAFGLEIVGDIEWSDGRYQFDLTVVFRDVLSGDLFYAEDSGCSCPSPFEDVGRNHLIPVTKTMDLITHLEERKNGSYEGDRSGEVGELLTKVWTKKAQESR